MVHKQELESDTKKKQVKCTGLKKMIRKPTRKEIAPIIIRRNSKKDLLELAASDSNEEKTTVDTMSSKISTEGGHTVRLLNKIKKIQNFWNSQTAMIPNVFRFTALCPESADKILEYQDLSCKEVLAQNGVSKTRSESTVCSQWDMALDVNNVNAE